MYIFNDNNTNYVKKYLIFMNIYMFIYFIFEKKKTFSSENKHLVNEIDFQIILFLVIFKLQYQLEILYPNYSSKSCY